MDAAELTDDDLDFAIDASQEWQCRWWGYAFRVTPEQVRAAVAVVGSSANAVREHLLAGVPAPAPTAHAIPSLGAR